MRFRRPSPALVVAFLALLVALGGVAVAAVPGPDGLVQFCYDRQTLDVSVSESDNPREGCPRGTRRFVIDSTPGKLTSPKGTTRAAATDQAITAEGPGANPPSVAIDRNQVNLLAGDSSVTVSRDAVKLASGSASIRMTSEGDIEIDGRLVNIKASGDVTIKGSAIGQN